MVYVDNQENLKMLVLFKSCRKLTQELMVSFEQGDIISPYFSSRPEGGAVFIENHTYTPTTVSFC